MIGALLSWLGGRAALPLATVIALLFAGAFAWQSVRIDGAPLLGGGLRAQIAGLEKQAAARDLAEAKAEAAMAAMRQTLADAGQGEARIHAVAQAANETQIQTVIREVPVYVSAKSDTGCIVPWGVVRLLDAAASGAAPDKVRERIAPGQPDDAASDVPLSEAVALLAANLGAARQNADQLEHLEKAVAGP